MPQRMDRLECGWQNVLSKLAGGSSQLLLRHDLILSKVLLVPAFQRLYNQGIHVPNWIREPMALKLHHNMWVAAQ
jgi:hypothetical protein